MPMNDSCSIEILLSIYRPNLTWLKEMLISIQNQTLPSSRILARYDDSCPQELEVSRNLNIVVLEDSKHRGSASSFFKLLEQSQGDFVLFCDQDDIWLEKKISALINNLSKQDLPALSFCSYRTITENSSPIKYRPFIPKKLSKFSFLFSNSVPGNCMMLNRQLVDLINDTLGSVGIPPWHDWWAISIAREFGSISRTHEPGVLYRIHSQNTVGIRHGLKRINFHKDNFKSDEPTWLQQTKMLVTLLEIKAPCGASLLFLKSLLSTYKMNRLKRLNFLILNGILIADPIDLLHALRNYVLPQSHKDQL